MKIRRPLIERALDLDPLSARALTELGFILRIEGDMEGSTRSFERAIELNPDFAPAYAGLGSNQFRAGQPEASRRSQEKAVEFDPKENRYRILLANAYWTIAQSARRLRHLRDQLEPLLLRQLNVLPPGRPVAGLHCCQEI